MFTYANVAMVEGREKGNVPSCCAWIVVQDQFFTNDWP